MNKNLRVLTFNATINQIHITKEVWKNQLVDSIIEISPDIAYLQECFNFHYWFISFYFLLPLHLIFQQIPILSEFTQFISYFILLEGFIAYHLNRIIDFLSFGYCGIGVLTYSAYDDFLYPLKDKYDIFYDISRSIEFNTIMNDGLFILVKKSSSLKPLPNSFKADQYSVNNGADQKIINLKVAIGKEILNLFNTHFHLSTDAKRIQLAELKNMIMKESMLSHFIIGGDLNLDYRDEAQKIQIDKFMNDLYLKKPIGDYITCIYDTSTPYHTYCDKQLDYILVGDAFKIINYQTPNVLKGSEHLCLIQDLEFTTPKNYLRF